MKYWRLFLIALILALDMFQNLNADGLSSYITFLFHSEQLTHSCRYILLELSLDAFSFSLNMVSHGLKNIFFAELIVPVIVAASSLA